jgi:hypothetical protein
MCTASPDSTRLAEIVVPVRAASIRTAGRSRRCTWTVQCSSGALVRPVAAASAAWSTRHIRSSSHMTAIVPSTPIGYASE